MSDTVAEATPTPTVTAAEVAPVVALAEAGAAQVLAAPAGAEPIWAKPAVSILALVLLGVAFVVAIATKDASALQLLVGAVISMAGTVVNYWLGSSSGSTAKNAIIAKGTPNAA